MDQKCYINPFDFVYDESETLRSSCIHIRKWYTHDMSSPYAAGLTSSTAGFYIILTMGQSNRRYSIDYSGYIFTSWWDYINKTWLEWESIK